jgi:hypothetical protein
MDVSGNVPNAQARLQKIFADMTQAGARARPQAAAGLTVLDVPPKGKRKVATVAVFFLQEGLLGVTDDVAVAGDILARLANPGPGSLSTLPAYQTVMKRAAASNPQIGANLSWFVDPIGLGNAVEADVGKPKTGRDMLTLVKKTGFDAVKGMGGLVTVSFNDYGIFHRTAILAPKPWQKSMNMLEFPNGGTFVPQPWVPSDVATYMSFQWNVQQAFENFDWIFDEIAGEGEPGVWKEILDSIKNDPNGPQLDIPKDLIAHLGHRATLITDCQLPVTTHSQRRLIAIETTNQQALEVAIGKMMENDKSIKQSEFQGHKVYEIIPEEADAVSLDVQNPGAGGNATQKTGPGSAPLPTAAVTVANGHLYVATHIDLLKKILGAPQAPSPLAQDVEYSTVTTEMQKLGCKATSLQGFNRNVQKWFLSYVLFGKG